MSCVFAVSDLSNFDEIYKFSPVLYSAVGPLVTIGVSLITSALAGRWRHVLSVRLYALSRGTKHGAHVLCDRGMQEKPGRISKVYLYIVT
jgi:hypothetical protein